MKIIGHRGARGLAPENTIASIKAAVEVGVDEIEIDARVTVDGIVVLSHDRFITDSRDNTRYVIKKFDYQTLKIHKPDLATLTEAIMTTESKCPLLIEIKPKENTSILIELLKKHLDSTSKPRYFNVASFDQNILRAIKKDLPELQLIVNERWSGVRATMRARELNTKRIHMNIRWLWIGFVKSMYNAGYQLVPYTVNNLTRVDKWKSYLHGVITDFPNRFKKSEY